MPRENENQHVETTPHFDGEKEGVINDPTVSAGSTIGIQVETEGRFRQEINPFHYISKKDKEMEHLGKLIGGKKIKD